MYTSKQKFYITFVCYVQDTIILYHNLNFIFLAVLTEGNSYCMACMFVPVDGSNVGIIRKNQFEY